MNFFTIIKKLFNQSSDERIKMITEGNLHATFMFIALPGIITMIIQSIMPILDGLIIYNFDSPVSGAAISYVNSFHNILITGLAGMATASAGVIGRINGQGDTKKSMHLSGQLLSLSTIITVILIPLVLIFMYGITFNQADAEFKSKILLYNSIIVFAIPFINLQTSYNSIKSVFGHPEMALVRILLFVPIKLSLSYIFLVKLNLGIVGSGVSTLLAYFIISLFIFYDLFIKKSSEQFFLHHFKLVKNDVITLYRKFWPSVVQNSTKSLAFFLVRLELVKYGAFALSASNVAGDLNQIFLNFTACYDAAIVSFVSVNIGANKINRAKESSRFALKIGVVSSIVLFIISHFATPFLIPLYSSDPELIEIATRTCIIYNFGILGFAVLFNEMPTFTGLGLTKISLLIQFLRIWVFRLGSMYLLYLIFPNIGFYAVFWSMAIANILGGIVSHIFYRKIDWQSFKSHT